MALSAWCAQLSKQFLSIQLVRRFGSKKDKLRKLPAMPFKGPRDFEYWRRLKKKLKKPRKDTRYDDKKTPIIRRAGFKRKKKTEEKK